MQLLGNNRFRFCVFTSSLRDEHQKPQNRLLMGSVGVFSPETPQDNLDMETGNAGFLKDGKKSSIVIDGNFVPMLH